MLIVGVAWLATSTRAVFTSDGKILSFGLNTISAAPPSLDIKFEPSGTHFENGKLKIRLDFYSRPESKSYSTYNVNVAGGKYQLNPCLSHFLTVPITITASELTAIINTLFTADVTATIDDAAIQESAAHLLSPLMRDKTGVSADNIAKASEQSIIDAVNARLSSIAIQGVSGGEIQEVAPESIDVGPGAVDLANTTISNTIVDKSNPANATGTLDTFEVWLGTACSANGKLGTAYVVSGNNLTTRDYENVGAISSGSKQTFTGLTISVTAGDYASGDIPTGAWDCNATTGSGCWREGTSVIPFTNRAFTWYSTTTMAIYATGTEPVSNPSVSNSPNSINLGTLSPSSTYYAKGSAPSNPVQDSECTFTITISDATADIFMTMADFTGGVGWNIVASDPSVDEVQITAYYSGQNPASGLVLSNSSQEFKSSQGVGTLKWDFKVVTGSSFTDGVTKVGVLTISVAAP